MKNTLKFSVMSLMLIFAVSSCKKNEKPTASADMEHAAEPAIPENNLPKTTAKFTKENHDFGTLKKGEMVQYVYEVTNTGTNPLIISHVAPACGCTAPSYTKEPIAPGQKGQVTLSFDSKNFSGEVSKTAEVHTNTDQTPITLSFKANVQ